jgi:hypothetical protein
MPWRQASRIIAAFSVRQCMKSSRTADAAAAMRLEHRHTEFCVLAAARHMSHAN